MTDISNMYSMKIEFPCRVELLMITAVPCFRYELNAFWNFVFENFGFKILNLPGNIFTLKRTNQFDYKVQSKVAL